jgi:hypothetical protein
VVVAAMVVVVTSGAVVVVVDVVEELDGTAKRNAPLAQSPATLRVIT